MKKEIISYLKEIGAYKPIHEPLVDNLVFNINVANRCLAEMHDGYKTNIETDGRRKPKYVKSEWRDDYLLALKEIKSLYNQLHLTLSDKVLSELIAKNATSSGDPDKKKKKEMFEQLFIR